MLVLVLGLDQHPQEEEVINFKWVIFRFVV
jgi:hypothetical protein